jgi:hypothetical protein
MAAIRSAAAPNGVAGRHVGDRALRDVRPKHVGEAWAATSAAQRGHLARNRSIDVAIDRKSTGSRALASFWPDSPSAVQYAQRSAQMPRVVSGVTASARAAPGWPLRVPLALVGSAILPFWPRDGGSEELPGVYGDLPPSSTEIRAAL